MLKEIQILRALVHAFSPLQVPFSAWLNTSLLMMLLQQYRTTLMFDNYLVAEAIRPALPVLLKQTAIPPLQYKILSIIFNQMQRTFPNVRQA